MRPAAGLARTRMTQHTYVHGYSPRESERLADQAQTLTNLLHHDTHYPAASGCSKPVAGSAPRL